MQINTSRAGGASIKFDGCSSQQHCFSMDFGYISQGGVEVQVVVGMLYQDRALASCISIMHWRRAPGSCISSSIAYLHRVSVSCISTVYQERVSKCAHKELKTESKLFQNGPGMPKKNPKSIPYGSKTVPDLQSNSKRPQHAQKEPDIDPIWLQNGSGSSKGSRETKNENWWGGGRKSKPPQGTPRRPKCTPGRDLRRQNGRNTTIWKC